MTEYAEVWHLTRQRLDEIYLDLSETQVSWRPFPKGHTVLEYLFHVAGVEFFYYSILTDHKAKNEYEQKLLDAVASDFLKEGPFPFTGSELTKDNAIKALAYTGALLGPIIEAPSDFQLNRSLISAQGAQTNGRGSFVRVAQHAGYHTGQIHLMRCDPEFPGA